MSLILFLALAAGAALSYVKLSSVEVQAELTGVTRVPQLQRMASLELNLTRASLQLRHAILARTPEELAATLKDIGERRRVFEQALDEYGKNLSTAAGKQRLEGLRATMPAFWSAAAENVKLIEAGQRAEAFAFLVEKTIPARNAVLEQLNAGVTYQLKTLTDDLADIRSDAHDALLLFVGLVLATGVAIGLMSWHVAGVLHRRVALARGVAERSARRQPGAGRPRRRARRVQPLDRCAGRDAVFAGASGADSARQRPERGQRQRRDCAR